MGQVLKKKLVKIYPIPGDFLIFIFIIRRYNVPKLILYARTSQLRLTCPQVPPRLAERATSYHWVAAVQLQWSLRRHQVPVMARTTIL